MRLIPVFVFLKTPSKKLFSSLVLSLCVLCRPLILSFQFLILSACRPHHCIFLFVSLFLVFSLLAYPTNTSYFLYYYVIILLAWKWNLFPHPLHFSGFPLIDLWVWSLITTFPSDYLPIISILFLTLVLLIDLMAEYRVSCFPSLSNDWYSKEILFLRYSADQIPRLSITNWELCWPKFCILVVNKNFRRRRKVWNKKASDHEESSSDKSINIIG